MTFNDIYLKDSFQKIMEIKDIFVKAKKDNWQTFLDNIIMKLSTFTKAIRILF